MCFFSQKGTQVSTLFFCLNLKQGLHLPQTILNSLPRKSHKQVSGQDIFQVCLNQDICQPFVICSKTISQQSQRANGLLWGCGIFHLREDFLSCMYNHTQHLVQFFARQLVHHWEWTGLTVHVLRIMVGTEKTVIPPSMWKSLSTQICRSWQHSLV